MKKYIIILLLMTSPLMAQENTKKETKKGIEYKRPVFGLNIGMGGGFFSEFSIFNTFSNSGAYLNVSLRPEFYVGKQNKVYFYLQTPLYGQIFPIIPTLNQFGFGVLIGMGGYIIEADKYNPWSVVMNGALGPAILFGREFPNNTEGVSGYATFYLSLDIRNHINEKYAIQFGFNGELNITIISSVGFSVNFQVGLVF